MLQVVSHSTSANTDGTFITDSQGIREGSSVDSAFHIQPPRSSRGDVEQFLLREFEVNWVVASLVSNLIEKC